MVHEEKKITKIVEELTMFFFALGADKMSSGIEKMEKAVELASDPDVSDEEAIEILGEGWVAEETLAIAIYCALRHSDSFEDAVCAAVNHNGDSDSTGAITGNIIGAYLGIEAIPDYYKEKVELKDVVIEMSDRLLV